MKKFQASLKKNQPTILQSWGYSGNSVTTNNTKNHTRTSHSTTPRKQENQSPTKIDCQSIEGQSIPDEDFADLFNEDIELHENNSVDKTSMKTTAQEVFLDGKFNKQVEKEIIAGFDTGMADTYIYPTNYPVRDYQFNIVRRALLENALVVLPTGLGKTFIASVVMYNFYRWYPNGKLIFMAPTKPLVAQQLEACYRIMGIPQKDTVEMNGAMAPGKRELLWKTRRVFFLTPQVLQNDLGRGTCFAPDVVCLVFDEAHRALGNHAYCQVVKEILRYRSSFRVLALSATPGIDMKAVQQVISNLLISHVEIRSEDNIDIQKYVHQRNVQKIVVPMSPKLKQIKITFLEVLRVFVKRLHSNNALWLHDPERLSKFHLLKSREQWRANNAAGDRVRMHMIEGDFGLCMSLYHAYELLQLHGLISFYTFLKGVLSGSKGTARSRCEMQRQPAFMQMMEQLHAEIEPDDGERSLNESIIDENQLSTKQRLLKSIPRAQPDFESHPKLTKLTEIVVEHFKKSHKDENLCSTQTPLNTRVMIFSQYRDSVQEITSMLSKHEPLVKVMSFIGQGAKEGASGRSTKGLTQKEQNEVLQKFRSGGFNTVVSTSVGEEGLDIGDVDLIVCFDASSSPIRLVQRMGRTGRKRGGKIIILVGEGKEETIYKRSLSNKKGIHKNLTGATQSLALYDNNHRMIPRHLNPCCIKTNIVTVAYRPNVRQSAKITANTSTRTPPLLNAHETQYLQENLQGPVDGCKNCKRLQGRGKYCSHVTVKTLSLCVWKAWQEELLPCAKVPHSTRSCNFCTLMQFSLQDKENIRRYQHQKAKMLRNYDIKSTSSLDNRVTLGQLWRKAQINSAVDSNSESDADDFEVDSKIDNVMKKKLRDEIFGITSAATDHKFNPISFESMLEKSAKSKNKKSRLRLMKLPRVETKEITKDKKILDNQVDFCSQITMPTLFNRCQAKRRDSDLRLLLDEEKEENSSEAPETLLPGKTETFLASAKFKEPSKVISTNFKTAVNKCPPVSGTISKFICNEEKLSTKKKFNPPFKAPSKTCVIKHWVNQTSKTTKQPKTFEAPENLDFENLLSQFHNTKTDEKSAQKEKIYMNEESENKNIKNETTSNDIFKNETTSHDIFKNEATSNDIFVFSEDSVEDSPVFRKRREVRKHVLEIAEETQKAAEETQKATEDLDNNAAEDLKNKAAEDLENKAAEASPVAVVIQRKRQTGKRKRQTGKRKRTSKRKDENNSDSHIPAKKMAIQPLKKRYKNEFIAYEADATCDESGLLNDTIIDNYVMDSFIDDATQVTPVVVKKKNKGSKEKLSPDMNLIYKQSLISPTNLNINFRTPTFHVEKSRYKLAENTFREEVSEDEAEEVMGIVEDIGDSDHGSDHHSDHGSDHHSDHGSDHHSDHGSDHHSDHGSDHHSDNGSDGEECPTNNQKKENFRFLDDSYSDEENIKEKGDQVNHCRQETISCIEKIFLDTENASNGDDKNFGATKNKGCISLKTDRLENESSRSLSKAKRWSNIAKNKMSKQEIICNNKTLKLSYEERNEGKSPIILYREEDLPPATFSFGLDWFNDKQVIDTTIPTQPLINDRDYKDNTTEPCDDKNSSIDVSPLVLIDSRCVANSQIPSLLRAKEKCRTEVVSQLNADYVISRRLAVNKRTSTDLSNIGAARRLLDQANSTFTSYEKQILILEKPRSKNKTITSPKRSDCNKCSAGIISKLIEMNVKILQSESQEETSCILYRLAKCETEEGFSISLPHGREKMVRTLLSVPNVTYPIACEICTNIPSLHHLIQCGLEQLQTTLDFLQPQRAAEIYFFFSRQFDIAMLGSKKTFVK